MMERAMIFHRARKFALAALMLACLVWSAHLAIRAHRITEFREGLCRRGFPTDYAERLAIVKYDHPSWDFSPIFVSDMTWDEVVDTECTPSWNLVAHSEWAPPGWEKLGLRNYLPYYAENAKAYDSGAWYQASREAIAYFMDPRNFLNEADVFQYETLEFDAASQTREAVENTLAGTFMAKANYDGGEHSFSELLYDVGKRRGISPVFLAGRLTSEQGGGSPQARGTIGDLLVGLYTNKTERIGSAVVWGKRFALDGTNTAEVVAKGAETYNGHYNFFNIGAFGDGVFEIKYNAWRESFSKETCERYCGPWTTQARSIEGGAIRIREKYIDSHRHTRYFQKFSVLWSSGEYRWKQYMQNIGAPLSESRNTCAAYDRAGLIDSPYRFLIPVYRNMPPKPCRDPAGGKSVYSPSR